MRRITYILLWIGLCSTSSWATTVEQVAADPLGSSCTASSPLLLYETGDVVRFYVCKNAVYTRTATHVDGTDCPAGQVPIGIDAYGNSEGCYAVAADARAPVALAENVSGGAGTDAQPYTVSTATWNSNLAGRRILVGHGEIYELADGQTLDLTSETHIECENGGTFRFPATRSSPVEMFHVAPGATAVTVEGCTFDPHRDMATPDEAGGGGSYIAVGSSASVNTVSRFDLLRNTFRKMRYSSADGTHVQILSGMTDSTIAWNTFDRTLVSIALEAAGHATSPQVYTNNRIVFNTFFTSDDIDPPVADYTIKFGQVGQAFPNYHTCNGHLIGWNYFYAESKKTIAFHCQGEGLMVANNEMITHDGGPPIGGVSFIADVRPNDGSSGIEDVIVANNVCHVADGTCQVQLRNVAHFNVTGNWARVGNGGTNCFGFHNVAEGRLSDNYCDGANETSGTPETGLSIGGSVTDLVVSDNTVRNVNTFLDVNSGAAVARFVYRDNTLVSTHTASESVELVNSNGVSCSAQCFAFDNLVLGTDLDQIDTSWDSPFWTAYAGNVDGSTDALIEIGGMRGWRIAPSGGASDGWSWITDTISTEAAFEIGATAPTSGTRPSIPQFADADSDGDYELTWATTAYFDADQAYGSAQQSADSGSGDAAAGANAEDQDGGSFAEFAQSDGGSYIHTWTLTPVGDGGYPYVWMSMENVAGSANIACRGATWTSMEAWFCTGSSCVPTDGTRLDDGSVTGVDDDGVIRRYKSATIAPGGEEVSIGVRWVDNDNANCLGRVYSAGIEELGTQMTPTDPAIDEIVADGFRTGGATGPRWTSGSQPPASCNPGDLFSDTDGDGSTDCGGGACFLAVCNAGSSWYYPRP